MSKAASSDQCAIFIDMGTTNTRVWLARAGHVLAKAQTQLGVRDVARLGAAARLQESLKTLIDQVMSEPAARDANPRCVIAAGMITSSLGLAEIPHIPAPAGLDELARGTKQHQFPDVTNLPVLLVPGVRCGPRPVNADNAGSADIMRGEETLCLGLLQLGLIHPPAVVLNLGSHWKAIQIDASGRIIASRTSLAGEMIHAIQSSTILASAVPQERPEQLDSDWLKAGANEHRRSGLARTLFCVRLLELSGNSTRSQRMAYLIGAFIAAEADSIISSGFATQGSTIGLVGSNALANAWDLELRRYSINSVTIGHKQTEEGMLRGLASVFTASTI